MKTIQISLVTLITMFTLQANAQLSVSLNLSSRPQYHNRYVNESRYYFLPEIEAYFDIQANLYIFNSPRGWVRSAYLPEYCRNYNINRGQRIALTYIGNTPFVDFNFHKQKYCCKDDRNYRDAYYNYRDQRVNYVVASDYNDCHNTNYYEKKDHHGNKHHKHDDCD
jgi:hypothetical protein